ncbi:hypothetical protein Rhal01_03798 [Rubritalea halochordaticola]|uniref:Uncharacterized protein n=1 Tax=Rubritalea halochordaticola TaxID=714537 RepID=A0ABP9VAF2_9BACT
MVGQYTPTTASPLCTVAVRARRSGYNTVITVITGTTIRTITTVATGHITNMVATGITDIIVTIVIAGDIVTADSGLLI